jgi:TRAP-type C4-dicarboxylate transport system permease small subunit
MPLPIHSRPQRKPGCFAKAKDWYVSIRDYYQFVISILCITLFIALCYFGFRLYLSLAAYAKDFEKLSAAIESIRETVSGIGTKLSSVGNAANNAAQSIKNLL